MLGWVIGDELDGFIPIIVRSISIALDIIELLSTPIIQTKSTTVRLFGWYFRACLWDVQSAALTTQW